MIERLWKRSTFSLAACLVLLGLLAFLELATIPALEPALAFASSTPSITAVDPNSAPNNLDISVTISGTGFAAVLSGTVVITPPSVYLGDALLAGVAWVSSERLTATVPWGQAPGVYTLTVANPDGGTAALPAAFTVTQAINVWTSGGPYGGDVTDLAVSPVVSTTAFAVVCDAGLFRTLDGGDHWTQLVFNLGIGSLAFGPPPTHTLYYGSEGSGLERSADGGETWHTLTADSVMAFALDPRDEKRLWTAGDYGLRLSTDGGQTWESRSSGLPTDPDIHPRRLAVHPLEASIAFVGWDDGRLYRTEDEGLHWDLLDNGLPAPAWGFSAQGLAIDPFLPDVVLYSRWQDNLALGYRSTDGGDTWQAIEDPEGCGLVYDPVFSPHLSGTVYTPVNENMFAASTDHGATWTCHGERHGDFMISLGLDPAAGLPAYLGGHSSGTWRSRDGGQSWQHAADGLTGLPIMDIASPRSDPETVYVAAEHGGLFASGNAGHTWRQLDIPFPGAFSAAVDPDAPGRIYIGADWGVYRSENGGLDWLYAAMPVTYQAFLDVMAISTSSPAVVYAGGRNDEASLPYNGVAFRSLDSGATWTPLDLGDPLGTVTGIAIDPSDSQRAYVVVGRAWPPSAPSAPDLLRSQDGGDTWQSIAPGPGQDRYAALAIRPDDPATIYVGAYRASEGYWTVFKSTDYGTTWQPTGLVLGWSSVHALAIDPLAPGTIYAGAGEGLFLTTNGGLTWTRAGGDLDRVPIYHLAITAAQDRSILYVGTPGGFPTGALGSDVHAAGDAFVQGGVYQFTIDHRSSLWKLYLPLVVR